MIKFSQQRLNEIFSKFQNNRIAVIGDLMLDVYIWGKVARISPEAPVPVVEVQEESYRFGGAANVGMNIKSLGGKPILIGVIGYDREGTIIDALMEENDFEKEGIFYDEDRPTTVKTRIIAHNQHVVRIDKEDKRDISNEIEEKILNYLNQNKTNINAIILEDYNKGMLTKNLIHKVIEFAKSNNMIITVDPKFDNFFEYKNVTVFKPNRKETEDALGIRLDSEERVLEAGKLLKEKLNPQYLLLTRGEKGMTLFNEDSSVLNIPTRARKVADVSGAGDTVIATLTMALAAGANIEEAATIANLAAGLVCEEVGVVPVDRELLYQTLVDDGK
ncbi:MAG: D-glycero-beta-D-manno-heptose-7-phosphate kinase [Ignavibacteria bacterium]|nr:D-glycero-beta-D-manno-heptose-7-phosphate kinase [Ignavibacteria bacterium]